MTKPKYTKPQVAVPPSLHQAAKGMKRIMSGEEVKAEVADLITKAVATLDWLLENGTPGTKLGAAQTILMPFVARAPQTQVNLDYDISLLSPEQQDRVIALAREYRTVVGSPAQGSRPLDGAEDRREAAQRLLLPAPGPETEDGAGWSAAFGSASEPEEGPDSSGGEQEREIDLGRG